MITDEQKQNIEFILTNYSQGIHFYDFKDWNITSGTKTKKIEKLLKKLEEDDEKLGFFKEWFNSFMADGANNCYVFDSIELRKEEVIKQFNNLQQEDLIDLGKEQINRAICIDKKDLEDRLVLRFVIDAKVMYKEENEGVIETKYENILYFYSVILDFELKQIIISIPHTTGLHIIFNREIGRGKFQDVVKHILDDINIKLGNISRDTCSDWIYDALDKLAEEGTAHNNPEITELCSQKKNEIKDFTSKLLGESGIEKTNIVNNLANGICDLYENALVEIMGIIEVDGYQAFKQNGDGVNSFFNVGSKTSSLKRGTEAAIAKKVRQVSDINILGIMKVNKDYIERFLIEVDSMNGMDFYIVKTDTSRFIREERLYEIVRKVASYK